MTKLMSNRESLSPAWGALVYRNDRLIAYTNDTCRAAIQRSVLHYATAMVSNGFNIDFRWFGDAEAV
jgi:hypothetical protein